MALLIRLYLVALALIAPVLVMALLKGRRELRVRALSQLAMTTVILGLLATGRPGVILLCLLLSGLAVREVHSLAPDSPQFLVWAMPLALLPVAAPFVLAPVAAAVTVLAAWAAATVVLFGLLGRAHVRWPALQALVLVVVGTGFGAMAQLGTRHGVGLLVAALALLQASDSFAYLGGKRLGRHKLAPAISPGKTIEGTLCGAVAAAAMAALLATPFLPALAGRSAVFVAGSVVLAVVFGTGGDLLLSLVKRRSGKKDFPVVLPGHGGVLDRFDSLVGLLPALLGWVLLAW